MSQPECFGSPTAYSLKSPVCQACQQGKACEAAASVLYRKLVEELGWDTVRLKDPKADKPAPKIASPRPPAAVAKKIETVIAADLAELPKNARRLVIQVRERGIDISGALKTGFNPYEGQRPAYMPVVCKMILDGGFTKRELTERLMADLIWKKDTASSHSGFVVQAMLHLGVIAEDAGRFTLKV